MQTVVPRVGGPHASSLAARRARGGNARRLVHELVRRQIVSLELSPGTALSENDLAARLGVSRTPVREALILLAEEGLVEVLPQAGTFVSRISVTSLGTAQFVREAIECAGLALAAVRATPGDHQLLEDLLARQERARDIGDADAFFALDEAFHAQLLTTAGQGDAWPVVSEAKTHLDRARRLSLPGDHRIDVLVEQHRRVADLLCAGRSEDAAAVLRDHLRLVLADVEAIRARHPDLFADDLPSGPLSRREDSTP